jgi:hypothetical protein
MKMIKLQIAKVPSYPPYGIVVGEEEYWDWDTASSSEEETLRRAKELYPHDEVILWSDPRHYSQQGN